MSGWLVLAVAAASAFVGGAVGVVCLGWWWNRVVHAEDAEPAEPEATDA